MRLRRAPQMRGRRVGVGSGSSQCTHRGKRLARGGHDEVHASPCEMPRLHGREDRRHLAQHLAGRELDGKLHDGVGTDVERLASARPELRGGPGLDAAWSLTPALKQRLCAAKKYISEARLA